MRHELIPLVLYDHDGFASDGLDAEPSFRWPDDTRGDAEWDEAVMPPLYGEPTGTQRSIRRREHL